MRSSMDRTPARSFPGALAACALALSAFAGATGTADGVGPNDSYNPSLSASGRLVAFSSYTGDFAADDTNDNEDVYLHDRKSGLTSLVSSDELGAAGGAEQRLSANGRFLAF